MTDLAAPILVVDDKQLMRDSVAAILQAAGYAPVVAVDGPSALALAAKHKPAAVVTDLKMPGMTGLELLPELLAIDDELPVVLMTAYGTVHDAVEAMRRGAFDFIQKPFEGDELTLTVRRAVEHRRLRRENAVLKAERGPSGEAPAQRALIGASPAMRQVQSLVERVAQSQGTVLIAGESGTGKEVVARTVHTIGPRRDHPMLCLNCAALSASLLESELFGHEKGAFTGADQLRKGRFELADGGTLLLDEVSEIGPELQAKLLRVLQEGQFERVGSSKTMQVDVRVIATTNRDLARSVAAGEFRQDLYYRLNVLPLHLPALRERVEDIVPLAEHFLQRVAQREGVTPKRLTEDAADQLARYPWPGNVRELQNICERASVLCPGEAIKGALLQPWLIAPMPAAVYTPMGAPAAAPVAPAPLGGMPAAEGLTTQVKTMEEVEREQILRTLAQFGGNRTRTAEALGIGLRTLGLKLKKWKEQELIAPTT